ncbi:MAG TPA: hypothetical protein VGZ29_00780 [Terriglobia bacterium]|nr:hypothetical protein [Terriglobia bacterium]
MIYHRQWFPFNTNTVHEHVPPTSGIYLLFSHQECAYVGASQDLKAELSRLVKDDRNSCLAEHPPDEFQFEVVLGDERNERRAELIGELNPTCKD